MFNWNYFNFYAIKCWRYFRLKFVICVKKKIFLWDVVKRILLSQHHRLVWCHKSSYVCWCCWSQSITRKMHRHTFVERFFDLTLLRHNNMTSCDLSRTRFLTRFIILHSIITLWWLQEGGPECKCIPCSSWKRWQGESLRALISAYTWYSMIQACSSISWMRLLIQHLSL